MKSPPPTFHILSKPRGAICNLNCSYCFYLKKEALYPMGNFRMSGEILETYIRDYTESQRTSEVFFAWQGGEPTLMGLAFFEKAVALQKRFCKPGMTIKNSIQTNGILLDDEWCRFFKQNDFLVGVSLDGPRSYHDAYRLDKGDQQTFDKVMTGLALLKQHEVEFNILATVHAANVDHPLGVYRFFRDEVLAQFIQFIPIVERKNQTGYQDGYQVTKRSVTGKNYGYFLISIFDEWVRRDVGRVFIQIFDVALGIWFGQPSSLCIFNETCGTALALEHNGDLYSCDHYVEPDYFLGNIQEKNMLTLVGSEKQTQFRMNKLYTLPQFCLKCDVRFACNGECPKNRIRRTPGGEEGLNYLCAGYKAFFSHIDKPLRKMVHLLKSGRPPSDIMPTYYRANQRNRF